jgi:hypothetical protein
MEYLVARNGVMVAVKNLEDATLAALLPVLLLEIVSSVATGSGIRNQRYWIPGFEQSAFEPHSPRLGGGPATARGRTHTLKPGSAMARAAAKRAISEVNRYLPVLTPRAGARVAALEDVLHGWPELMATRSTIQSRRRRSEAEIATLFGLDEQTREPTGYPALDKTTAAVYRALEAVGLERLLPRA